MHVAEMTDEQIDAFCEGNPLWDADMLKAIRDGIRRNPQFGANYDYAIERLGRSR